MYGYIRIIIYKCNTSSNNVQGVQKSLKIINCIGNNVFQIKMIYEKFVEF